MPLPTTKSELLENLQTAFSKLDNEFDGLTPSLASKKAIDGNISDCDVLAYQIGWGRLLLGWEKAEREGKIPDMPSQGYKWNELGQLAQSFYKSRQRASLEELRADFKQIVSEISEMIEGLPSNDLFKTKKRKWTGEEWPMVKWIQINTIAPYSSARTKLRR